MRAVPRRYPRRLSGSEARTWIAPPETPGALGLDALESPDAVGRRSRSAGGGRRRRVRPRQPPYLVPDLPPPADPRTAAPAVAPITVDYFSFTRRPRPPACNLTGRTVTIMIKRLNLPVLALAGLLAIFSPVVVFGQHGGGHG